MRLHKLWNYGGASRRRSVTVSDGPQDHHSPPDRPSSSRTLCARLNGGVTRQKNSTRMGCGAEALLAAARSRFGSEGPPDPHSPPNRPSSNRTLCARLNGGVTRQKNSTRMGCCFFGGATRNRTGDEGFADPCLTAWPWRRTLYEKAAVAALFDWSGKRGSNPPPQPWQGCALPNELFPQDGASEWT